MQHPSSNRLRPLLTCAAVLAASALTSPASGEGTALKANLVEAKSLKLDGVLKEWSGLQSLSYAVKGKGGKPDIEAKASVAYDNNTLYIAADVTDDALRGGGDHLEVVIGFPGGVMQEVLLYPGEPGKSAGNAKTKDGSPVSGAKVIEAPRSGGWSLEASVPWSAFPQARLVRVGLRGAIFAHDADSGQTIRNVVGTAPSAAYASLPSLATETEQALADGLLRDKGVKGGPRHNMIADVAGDAMKERILVFDRYLVVLGPTFRKGTEYYFSDLGVDPSQGMLPSIEVRDLTGDGQAEIILRKRFGNSTRFREMVQILCFGNADVPVVIFQHELGLTSEAGSVANELTFIPDGVRTAIKITPGTAKGFNAGNYHEATESTFDPLLLPWGTIAAQTYKYGSATFTKVTEDRQAPTAAPPASATPPPPRAEAVLPKAPPAMSPNELLEKVYEAYKKDRNVSGRPKFDIGSDVVGDKQAERVLVHDRDIVIFGKGFKGGSGYSFLNLPMFAAGSDIIDLTARDLTGDGKAEIILKGLLHVSVPKEAGTGTIDREVMLIFQVANDAMKRIFAVETARSMGKKRVQGSIQFPSGSKGQDIEISSGKAIEWTEQTYPFKQEGNGPGGFEPLILPWSGWKPVRYRWSGTAFSR
jgi:hypothetical protein